ncbi:BLUF domain-containing protein [Lichenihabitans sp. Uapishka_5]|uniref:BLUF domain-containing protein n=1 Tax=Lichenihabitans sp. Uapishka_5 TaxID=3037302 RepID=UPI0029E7CD78|nr:BLUF domain-containing protein [Lichenihabitans sp. Uapishka_5]MDX7950269.1 BLUF domain-containing protein [Lichenihabitans sp. Uapishka_5]
MSHVYRLIYMSRSAAAQQDALAEEVRDILAASRRNNLRVGITGALVVNARAFVQVLEGSRSAVEETFERILCDTRHEAISVLQCETVSGRIFAGWDMASVERSERGITLLKTLSPEAARSFSPTEGDRFCATLLAMVRADSGPVAPLPSRAREDGGQRADAEPDRADKATLAAPHPVTRDTDALVLRGLLDEERERTTALRRDLDDARVALAQAQGALEDAGRHRDIWADRGKQLRTSLAETRNSLRSAQQQSEGVEKRLGACEAERDRLRAHRDIWAERTRTLAATLCRDPATNADEVRPPAAMDGVRLSVVPN